MATFMSYEEFLAQARSGDVCGKCPFNPICRKLRGKWKPQICYLLCIHSRLRFSQLKRELPGINNSMLAASLREMEADGLIRREQYSEMPARVEYSPTEMGQELLPIFHQLLLWGFKYGDGRELDKA